MSTMTIHRLQQHARHILSHNSKSRLFCSNTNDTLCASNQTLQSQIESALHQNSKISTVLEQWRQQGNKLDPSMVRGIFEKLRDSKQYPQALDVSQWMTERKICSLAPEDYTTRFHLIENVLGFEEAEKFLEKVLENNVKLYSLEIAKAYLRVREAREMLLRAEELKETGSYVDLMRLYSEAGDSEDVNRIWNLYKKTGEQDNEGFLALIGSLLNLDDINGAEDMYYKEYECSGLEFDVRIPTMLVSGFHKNGMVQQADILMNKTLRKISFGNKPITQFLEEWGKMRNQVKPSELRDLIKNLQDSNKFSKALEASSWLCDQEVVNLFPEDYANRLVLTENVLGLKEADKFFDTSIPATMKDYSVYTTLLNNMKNMGHVVMLICLVIVLLMTWSHVAAADPNFAVVLALLCLCDTFSFFICIIIPLLVLSNRQ